MRILLALARLLGLFVSNVRIRRRERRALRAEVFVDRGKLNDDNKRRLIDDV